MKLINVDELMNILHTWIEAADDEYDIEEFNRIGVFNEVLAAIRSLKPVSIEYCSDYISRQAAIDVVRKWFDKIGLNGDICIDGIISLPSAQKIGKWVEHKTDDGRSWLECPICHIKKQYPITNYCPKCGSRNTEKDIPDENGWVR